MPTSIAQEILEQTLCHTRSRECEAKWRASRYSGTNIWGCTSLFINGLHGHPGFPRDCYTNPAPRKPGKPLEADRGLTPWGASRSGILGHPVRLRGHAGSAGALPPYKPPWGDDMGTVTAPCSPKMSAELCA